MNIFIIAAKNLKIRFKSYFYSLVVLVIGITSFVTFSNIISAMNFELGDRIDEFGANAIIYPNSAGTLEISDIEKIKQSDVNIYLNIISPKLIGQVRIEDTDVLIVGILPEFEFAQKPWLVMNQAVAGEGQGEEKFDFVNSKLPHNALIFGADIANVIDADIQDEIRLGEEIFIVYGILDRTGGDEDGLIFANLESAQSILGKPDGLTLIEISAYCNECPIEEVAMGIEESLINSTAIPIKQAAIFREETIEKFSGFGYILTSIILLVSLLTIFKTVMSSVNQRTREIGIFRAIGFSSFNIIKIIIYEISILSIISGVLGFIAGSLIFVYAGLNLANLQSDFTYDIALLIPALTISVGISIVAAIYPALKAAKLDPVRALRFI